MPTDWVLEEWGRSELPGVGQTLFGWDNVGLHPWAVLQGKSGSAVKAPPAALPVGPSGTTLRARRGLLGTVELLPLPLEAPAGFRVQYSMGRGNLPHRKSFGAKSIVFGGLNGFVFMETKFSQHFWHIFLHLGWKSLLFICTRPSS